tara:strand:+ start:1992 stop:2321 length:330 start_codon:yes stop_codon:yes gene_type:complete
MTHDPETFDVLEGLNISELVKLAEEQGLGLLSPALSRSRLMLIVAGETEPEDTDLCPSGLHRTKLSNFVERHADIVRSQLPLCGGRCLTHGCPVGIAVNCFDENRKHVQ